MLTTHTKRSRSPLTALRFLHFFTYKFGSYEYRVSIACNGSQVLAISRVTMGNLTSFLVFLGKCYRHRPWYGCRRPPYRKCGIYRASRMCQVSNHIHDRVLLFAPFLKTFVNPESLIDFVLPPYLFLTAAYTTFPPPILEGSILLPFPPIATWPDHSFHLFWTAPSMRTASLWQARKIAAAD